MKPYTPDMHWLWESGVDDPIATLRLTVTHRDARMLDAAVTGFFASIPADSNGVHGEGGWAAYMRDGVSTPDICGCTCGAGMIRIGNPVEVTLPNAVIDLVAGGEDIADAIEYAADTAYRFFSQCGGIELKWEQLPIVTADQPDADTDASLPTIRASQSC